MRLYGEDDVVRFAPAPPATPSSSAARGRGIGLWLVIEEGSGQAGDVFAVALGCVVEDFEEGVARVVADLGLWVIDGVGFVVEGLVVGIGRRRLGRCPLASARGRVRSAGRF